MLTVEDQAPNFTLNNENGDPITLTDLKGKKIILYFYPKDNTPGCTKQAVAFTEQLKEFNEKNTVIFGVSKDSIQSHQNFIKKHNLTISLLSDPDGTVCEQYGVWKEKKNYGKTYMGIVRSTFLIDETGKIKKIWNNVKVDGHVETVNNSI